MEYRIVGVQNIPDDIPGVYESVLEAIRDLEKLRREFPGADLAIEKDGVALRDAGLKAEIETAEIQEVREQESRLPSTYRHGHGTERDDVAEGADGSPTKVWGPDNPGDRFD